MAVKPIEASASCLNHRLMRSVTTERQVDDSLPANVVATVVPELGKALLQLTIYEGFMLLEEGLHGLIIQVQGAFGARVPEIKYKEKFGFIVQWDPVI